MPTATVNGVRLSYELTGRGQIHLVLVHGSWGSRHSWERVVSGLGECFQVLTYDRRGHSESERVARQGSVREDVADLAALIERLNLAPSWVVGSSFGGSITLRLAGERPDLLKGAIAHEPPLLSLLEGEPAFAPSLEQLRRRIDEVMGMIVAGDHAGAAEHFCETLALGPGTWAQLPSGRRQTFIENAFTFADEANDPEQMSFNLAWVSELSRPVLLTLGERSLPLYIPIVEKLASALPMARVLTYPGAGHIPHSTHPDIYVATVTDFIQHHEAPSFTLST
jgi:pimeloyl-ACP methyl ester carboxylesterase